jgi:hypothetical protein
MTAARSSFDCGEGIHHEGALASKLAADQALAELAELEAAELLAAVLAPDVDGEDEAGLWPLTLG